MSEKIIIKPEWNPEFEDKLRHVKLDLGVKLNKGYQTELRNWWQPEHGEMCEHLCVKYEKDDWWLAFVGFDNNLDKDLKRNMHGIRPLFTFERLLEFIEDYFYFKVSFKHKEDCYKFKFSDKYVVTVFTDDKLEAICECVDVLMGRERFWLKED